MLKFILLRCISRNLKFTVQLQRYTKVFGYRRKRTIDAHEQKFLDLKYQMGYLFLDWTIFYLFYLMHINSIHPLQCWIKKDLTYISFYYRMNLSEKCPFIDLFHRSIIQNNMKYAHIIYTSDTGLYNKDKTIITFLFTRCLKKLLWFFFQNFYLNITLYLNKLWSFVTAFWTWWNRSRKPHWIYDFSSFLLI